MEAHVARPPNHTETAARAEPDRRLQHRRVLPRQRRHVPSDVFQNKLVGEGPAEMMVGRRRMISLEAAAQWRREREEAARKSQESKKTKEIA
jgi:hypothetical protein